ncbi:MAG: Smr/MutS family protein [Clostridiales Family XIII bacterium]|jgi:DNA mismatch repair protein MutS2|nr:Smr/MutS family protein [Clostridiales Family XIII bacterium]
MAGSARLFAVLEYDKITGLLAERTASALGAEAALALEPVPVYETVRERLAETAQAVLVMMRKGALPLGEFGDIRQPVQYADKGGVLTMAQLLMVSRQMNIARRASAFLRSDVTDVPVLSNIAVAIESDKYLEERIEAAILSDTDMADTASPELRRIRRNIHIQNDSIRAQLNKMITSASYADLLRDQLITQRDGRWVVPVKQEHAGRVSGIVHDRSKGGATVFIEPQGVVNANNALRQLESDEAAEIERILAELSASVGGIAHSLLLNQELLVALDLIFAKGRLAEDMKATQAVIHEDSMSLLIEQGRHPLIDPEKVVPISLAVGDSYSSLIITGPNTGGKTVTLKTVGLFILMTEAGLFVPAAEAVIPLAKDVFADIGDEQSIEQSLSTFSSHMKNIVEITSGAGRSSVVLLDELGAGTDPAEGAALAISILEELRNCGALVLATTHYTELKKYALSEEGAMNASMEFDVETLSPTYRLRLGTPGRSNAFEISRRLGLDGRIVDRAATYMDSGSITFESVIEEVERDRIAAASEREEAERVRADLEKRRADFQRSKRDFEEKREAMLEKASAGAAEKIEEAEEYADIIKAELKALIEEAGDAPGGDVNRGDLYRRFDDNRKMLDALKDDYKSPSPEKNSGKKAAKNKNGRGGGKAEDRQPALMKKDEIKVGDLVQVKDFDAEAEILTLPDDKGDVSVLIGRIKMTVPAKSLRRADAGGAGARGAGGSPGGRTTGRSGGSSGQVSIVRTKMNSISSSVDVHGQNLDDASMNVEKYIDDAFLAGLHEVSIIHGRGEGILKTGLRRLLKSNKHVKALRPGDAFEGGDGVTIVTLK